MIFKFYSLCLTGLFNDVAHDGREGVCVCVIVRGKQEGREVAERVCLEGGESEGGGM